MRPGLVPEISALILVALLAGCFHRVDATFTVWNHTREERQGSFGVYTESGRELYAFPFWVGAAADGPVSARPDDSELRMNPGTYRLWASVLDDGRGDLEESVRLDPSVVGIQLQIDEQGLSFQLVVT